MYIYNAINFWDVQGKGRFFPLHYVASDSVRYWLEENGIEWTILSQ